MWSYNSSIAVLKEKMSGQIEEYNRQQRLAQGDKPEPISKDPTKIKWCSKLISKFSVGKVSEPFCDGKCCVSVYRPFFKQFLYYDQMWNNTVSQMPLFFPTGREENWLICISSVGDKEFSVLMTDVVPDVHYVATSQCFPLYLYDRAFGQKSQDLFSEAGSSGKEGRRYAITDTALTRFRTQYQTNLMKDLPRIPLVPDLGMFRTFTEAGRKLADLHVNYESVEPYDGVTVDGEDSRNYRVEQLKYGKIPGKTGNAGKDKTVIVYNGSIVIRNIPLKAQEYVVNRKSALDWLVERIGVSVDKDSGIVNDFNKFAEEKGEPLRRSKL